MSKMEHTHQKLLVKSNTIHRTIVAVPPGHPGANQPTFFKKLSFLGIRLAISDLFTAAAGAIFQRWVQKYRKNVRFRTNKCIRGTLRAI